MQPTVEYEQKLIQNIETKISEYNKLKKTKPTARNGFTNNPVGLDDVYDVLRTVANLLNFEKLKNPKSFEQYKNHKDFETYNYFLFAIDMKNFDYNKFKLEYLNYLTKNKKEKLRQIINKDISKKKIIKEKFINIISLDRDNEIVSLLYFIIVFRSSFLILFCNLTSNFENLLGLSQLEIMCLKLESTELYKLIFKNVL